jgi:N-acetylglucosamine-6-sulfatase
MGAVGRRGGLALAVAVAGALAAAAPAAAAPASSERPNVVVIMSDDQTQDSIRYMARVNELIGARGATFPVSVTNWPLCCPSRATLLTGQYAHNHGVLGNAAPFGGFDRLNSSETLPVWLQRAGYYTAHIGKFLNGYENSAVGVPPGWSEWHGSKRTYLFYGYELLENGQRVAYGSNLENPDAPGAPQTYSTDVYTDKAVELIGRLAPERRPFFLSLAYLAPHGGGPNPDPPNQSRCNGTAKPAPRHLGAFASEPLPQPPNFNEADVSDKPAGFASRPALTPEQIANVERRYRCRAESLLAIDEGVERVVGALRDAGELDDTLVIYTSDNGFFHGEHRVALGKNRVYEEAIRVPLLLRGPGVARGVSVAEPAINADLAPTILDAAGAEAPVALDGRSLLQPAAHPSRLRGRELLIEQQSGDDDEIANGVFYAALRNSRYTYVSNASGETELYDLAVDPFQLQNQVANPAYDAAEAALAARLAALRACVGSDCRSRPPLKLKLPPAERRGGRSCRSPGDFLARVRGAASSQLVLARFEVGGRAAGSDRLAPFKERLAPRLLRRKRRPLIQAFAELLDGRLASLQKRVRVCR